METGTTTATRFVYGFGGGEAEGGADMVDVLGGKGANLHEMSRLGIPVPPGFTISTEACRAYHGGDGRLPDGLEDEVRGAVRRLESLLGRGFGDPSDPLLVSVRSGAPVSMPGMMDTVLNLGLSPASVLGLAQRSGSERFAWDSYRRLVQMYGEVVRGIPAERFDALIEARREERGAADDRGLEAGDWRELTAAFLEIYAEETGEPFPQDPEEQLRRGIAAVFDSWNTPRAVTWRRIHGLPHDVGTGVNVQAMVFGNLGEHSASGVAFTRDPATGDPRPVGEYLPDAQGEDIVSGTRTPHPLNAASRGGAELPTLERTMPGMYRELEEVFGRLERHYREMQDLEFTVQEGELFILQTRTGKRTAAAMVRIAHDMAVEGFIGREQAIHRVDPSRLEQLLHPSLAPDAREGGTLLAVGLAASPGAASGRVVFDAAEAERAAARGEDVILVRRETSADDVGGMHAARGILTSRGGGTSHAAVVARGMGRPCVTGCSELRVDVGAGRFEASGRTVKAGTTITIDGTSGEVYLGELETLPPALSEEALTLLGWGDDLRRLGVRANADTPEDARKARELGAEGIGLCRTEHMFFAEDRIDAVRRVMLLAPEVRRLRAEAGGEGTREGDGAGTRAGTSVREGLAASEAAYGAALDELRPLQRADFEAIFEAMEGLPVTVRLLDPPLHEFLPREREDVARLAGELGLRQEEVEARIAALREENPMLGHRGCRLGLTYPDIYRMQAAAVAEAAVAVGRRGVEVEPEIMVPLVADREELARVRSEVEAAVGEVAAREGVELRVPVGTMIELPRAALVAERIAEVADFFSFGTNDLTQTAYGVSRDDASGTFLAAYLQQGILREDPFRTLDVEGVGELVRIGVERGRRARPELPIGICGEHGGDPRSVAFCHDVGLDYVSCSPYRLPVARIAAAQAAVGAPEDVSEN